MCIAILNNTSKPLTKKTLKNCWIANNDGGGLLYVENRELKVFKEMNNFKVLMKEYRRIIEEIKPSYIVLHFRIATHGRVNLENCHPFLVTDKLGFVHNGVITNTSVAGEFDKSDTNVFNERILQKLDRDFIYSDVGKELIKEYIGWSKLIFLDNEENPLIIGELKGDWDDGNWFSNGSYKDKEVSTYSGHGGGGYWEHKNGVRTFVPYSTMNKDYSGRGAWQWDNDQNDYIPTNNLLLKGKDEEEELDEVETCDNCDCDLIHEFELKVNLCNTCIRIYDLEDEKKSNVYTADDYGV